MKDSLIVLGVFVGGCLLGALGYFPVELKTGNMSIYILYALMFQIGISIGSNKELKSMISQLRLKFLLIPLATISGTLAFPHLPVCCSAAGVSSTVWRWEAALLIIPCHPC